MSRSLVVFLAISAAALGCAAPSEPDEASASADADLTEVPPANLPGFLAGLEWMNWLKDNYRDWYFSSRPDEADSRAWSLGYDPARDSVFAHDEIDIAGASPHDVLALLAAGRSDTYYANSGPALDCATRRPVTLALGLGYCWVTFGTEQHMKIVELVDGADEAVVAWEGGSPGVSVYHRWIARRTPAGTHVVTEECERGILPKLPVYSRRMNPSLHAGHELWLHGMRDRLER